MDMLPIVHNDIGFSLARDLVDKFDDEYVKQNLKNLKRKNPAIAEFIKYFSDKADDKNGVAFCGIIVYKMLESQAEADQMKEDIKLK